MVSHHPDVLKNLKFVDNSGHRGKLRQFLQLRDVSKISCIIMFILSIIYRKVFTTQSLIHQNIRAEILISLQLKDPELQYVWGKFFNKTLPF